MQLHKCLHQCQKVTLPEPLSWSQRQSRPSKEPHDLLAVALFWSQTEREKEVSETEENTYFKYTMVVLSNKNKLFISHKQFKISISILCQISCNSLSTRQFDFCTAKKVFSSLKSYGKRKMRFVILCMSLKMYFCAINGIIVFHIFL